jgi:hypothetical protein
MGTTVDDNRMMLQLAFLEATYESIDGREGEGRRMEVEVVKLLLKIVKHGIN